MKPELIDARGLSCPLPTLNLRRALEALAPGAQVELHATDPMAAVDIPHFCTQYNHVLVSQTQDTSSGKHPVHIFVIEKGDIT